MQNKSKRETFNAVVTLRVDSTLYTGKLKSLVKKETFQLSLKPGQGKRANREVGAKKRFQLRLISLAHDPQSRTWCRR